MSVLTEQEFAALRGHVRERYERSGLPPDVVQALAVHNDRVLEHAEAICRGEGLGPQEAEIVRTIAVLHDIAKADTHLMLHAEEGSEAAAEILAEMGKDEPFIAAVCNGILSHMGPFPFVDEEARKYKERTGVHIHAPRPSTKLEKFFYDADMLALIDIEGIEKIVKLRATSPEFIEEDKETAAREGVSPKAAAYFSALHSLRRAVDTMFSDTARAIASQHVAESERYVADRIKSEPANP